MLACQQENTDMVRLLFQYDIDVNATTEDGYTTLMAAIDDTDEAFGTVRRLLEKGADVNVRNSEGETALFFAADKGMFDIVNLLHEYGADMRVKNSRGKTALIETLQAEEQTRVAEAYWKDTTFGDEETKKRKQPEFAKIAEFLIAHDVDVNARDLESNMTALMFAAMCGENGIIKQLLDLGADVNMENDHETAFTLSIRYRQKESAKLLLQSGATVKTIDRKDITPVVNAIFNKQQTSFSEYLKNGIDVHIELQDKSSLLLYAVIAGNIAAVEALIEHGADISSIDRDGKNALLTAIDVGDIAVIKILLQKGANVNERIKIKTNEFQILEWTPLIYAVQAGQKETVQLLLDSGADVKIRTKDSLIATTFARSKPDILILLLEAGAELDPIPR